jgi:DNA adenine methylase
MSIPHPIPYQGSKRYLAPTIVGYFPADVARLIEPFAGSGAVSLFAAQMGKADNILLNDINMPLMLLWDAIINHPDDLAKYYQHLWQAQQGRERQFYDRVRLRFNRTHRPYYLLYLLARCVKAAVRYNANGEFNQSPDNRRKGKHPTTMRQDILAVSQLLKQKTQLFSEDYRSILRCAEPSDIVYLDPPYQGVSKTRDPRYMQSVEFDIFVSELQDLNQRNISYIVSYDGRTGTKIYGRFLPDHLQLERIEIAAGRSSQATLLGQNALTYESLYLSPALSLRLSRNVRREAVEQQTLFPEFA